MTEEEFRTAKKAEKPAKTAAGAPGKALKDFHIFCPPHDDIKITKGDDLALVPEKYHNNLITEGVMKGT